MVTFDCLLDDSLQQRDLLLQSLVFYPDDPVFLFDFHHVLEHALDLVSFHLAGQDLTLAQSANLLPLLALVLHQLLHPETLLTPAARQYLFLAPNIMFLVLPLRHFGFTPLTLDDLHATVLLMGF